MVGKEDGEVREKREEETVDEGPREDSANGDVTK